MRQFAKSHLVLSAARTKQGKIQSCTHGFQARADPYLGHYVIVLLLQLSQSLHGKDILIKLYCEKLYWLLDLVLL